MHNKIQSSICEWASILTKENVTSLKKIEDLTFTHKLLSQVDNNVDWTKFGTFSSILDQIVRYYKKQIELDISQNVNGLNIYKNSMELWQLILGMAIKGRKYQQQINMILTMQDNEQEQMMGLISSIIYKLEKFNTVQSEQNQQTHHRTQMNLLMQVAQQNERYKQKIQQLEIKFEEFKEGSILREKQLEFQLKQLKNNQKRFYNQVSDFEIFNINLTSGSGYPTPAEILHDICVQYSQSQQQNSILQDKISMLEQRNKQLYVYCDRAMSLQKLQQQTNRSLLKSQKQIKQLKKQIKQIEERQNRLLKKIRTLQDQKYNLVEIVNQIKNAPPPQSVTSDIMINDDVMKLQLGKNVSHDINPVSKLTQRQYTQRRQQLLTKRSVYERDNLENLLQQAKFPAVRERFETEIQSLLMQIQHLQEQNVELRNLNIMLEQIVNKFTEQNNDKIQEYQERLNQLNREINVGGQQNQKIKQILEDSFKGYRQKQQYYLAKIARLDMKVKELKSKKRKPKNKKTRHQPLEYPHTHNEYIQQKHQQEQQAQQPHINIETQPQQIQGKSYEIQTQTIQIPQKKLSINLSQFQIQINTQPQEQKIKYKSEIIEDNDQNSFLKVESQNTQYKEIVEIEVQDDYQIKSRRAANSYLYQANSQIIDKMDKNMNSEIQKPQISELNENQSSSQQQEDSGQDNMSQEYDRLDDDGSILKNNTKTINAQIKNQLNDIKAYSNQKIKAVQSQLNKVTYQYNRLNELYGHLMTQAIKENQQIKQNIIETKNIIPCRQINYLELQHHPEWITLTHKHQSMKKSLLTLTQQKQDMLKQLESIKQLHSKENSSQIEITSLQNLIMKLKSVNINSQEQIHIDEIDMLKHKINELQDQNRVLNEELNIVAGIMGELRQMSMLKIKI